MHEQASGAHLYAVFAAGLLFDLTSGALGTERLLEMLKWHWQSFYRRLPLSYKRLIFMTK